jgi:hypothetical protein
VGGGGEGGGTRHRKTRDLTHAAFGLVFTEVTNLHLYHLFQLRMQSCLNFDWEKEKKRSL